ncbi:MAG: hypothetical protein ACKORF_01065 [Micrococcales bacterium]
MSEENGEAKDSKSAKYQYKYKNKNKNYDYRGRIGDGGLGWLGFCAYIGAAVYFVSQSPSFWEGAFGLVKALVWPAFLVFQGLSSAHV